MPTQKTSVRCTADFQVIYGAFYNPESDQEGQWEENGMIILKKVKNTLGPLSSPQWVKSQPTGYQVHWIGAESAGKKILADLSLKTSKSPSKSSGKRPVAPPTFAFFDYSEYLLIPAFFDMHFHWVQDDVRLMPKDDLLHWLSHYTWPHESLYAKKTFSQKKAKEFFPRLQRVGTLGGAIYSSLHEGALDAAMNQVQGDFLIGNVLMTMNSPEYLIQTQQQALQLSKKFLKKYGKRWALTPRFAPTTHPEVMQKTGMWANQHKNFIQTHLSETTGEIDYVLALFREFADFSQVKTYTDIYHQCGLLGPRTLMGHGIHLSAAEYQLLAKTQTKIIHCPTSNAPIPEKGLGSGLCLVQQLEKYGVEWALGSDIGGGPYLSMLDVIQSFVYQHRRAKQFHADYQMGIFRSTLASAKILGLGETHGNLSAGKWANFLLLPKPEKRNGVKPPKERLEGHFEALLAPFMERREQYDEIVWGTFYQGHPLYMRRS